MKNSTEKKIEGGTPAESTLLCRVDGRHHLRASSRSGFWKTGEGDHRHTPQVTRRPKEERVYWPAQLQPVIVSAAVMLSDEEREHALMKVMFVLVIIFFRFLNRRRRIVRPY
ncbi:hypothetical protein EJ110_NYTH24125 [Nymphaea thermarum]|nr:hypothetical protein EJ110_NYTH24125 [Nymphaea thermarum]